MGKKGGGSSSAAKGGGKGGGKAGGKEPAAKGGKGKNGKGDDMKVGLVLVAIRPVCSRMTGIAFFLLTRFALVCVYCVSFAIRTATYAHALPCFSPSCPEYPF